MKRGIDWLGIMVRFGCGAVIGAIAGLSIGASALSGSRTALLAAIAIGAAAGGTLSAVLGDEFWKNLDWLTWW